MRTAAVVLASALLIGITSCSPGADSQDGMPNADEMFERASALLSAGGEANLREAINAFSSCIESAPDHAACQADLARTYVAIGPNYNIMSPSETRGPARQAAEKAVQLDPSLAEAHLAMAEVLSSQDWDWDGAEREHQRAVELAPNDISVLASYAWFLVGTRRTEEASATLAEIQELEPGFSDPHLAYLATGDAESALQAAGALIEADPTNPAGFWARANIFAAEGDYGHAAADLRNQIPLMNGDVVDEVALLGYLYARMDDEAQARQMLERLDELAADGRYVSPINRAWVHAGLGDVDETVSLLREGIEGHANRAGLDMTLFAFTFERVNTDPRFRTVLGES